MTAVKKPDLDENGSLAWAIPLRRFLGVKILEAMRLAPEASVQETIRRWCARAWKGEADGVEDWLSDAWVLAVELAAFARSKSGARPVDRLAQRADQKGDDARTAQWLRSAKFRLFRILSARPDGLCEARDLATGAAFHLFEDRLDPAAFGVDLAARLCPFPGDIQVLAGPLIPLALGGRSTAPNYVRPGQGIGDDQRCAGLVYRDYVRGGASAGVDFGLRPGPGNVVRSHADEELDGFVDDWHDLNQGPTPIGLALADARALTNATRIVAALTSTIELRAAGFERPAAIYEALARIMMETVHLRAQVGSGETKALDKLRTLLIAEKLPVETAAAALAVFDALAREISGPSKPAASPDDDLTRVIERIRALRAKTTEQGCTEQEALRAAEKVAELLERYGLSLSEIELRKQTCEGFGIDTGRKKREPYDRCMPAIADFCDCRVWTETGAAGTLRYVFFGLPADIEAARYLKDLVAAAFDTETALFRRGGLFGKMTPGERRGATSSFQIGLASGISGKLAKLKSARQASADKSTGRDLMVVKASILDEELEKLGLSFVTRPSRARRRVIAAAYAEGQAAAGRFKVNEGIR